MDARNGQKGFSKNPQKNGIRAQKNQFFSELRQFQRNPRYALESPRYALSSEYWVLGVNPSRFGPTVDFVKFTTWKITIFLKTHLRFSRELQD